MILILKIYFLYNCLSKYRIINIYNYNLFHFSNKKAQILVITGFEPYKILLVAGLEPARCCHRGILSPLRLPIPPHQRMDGGGFEPPKQFAADLQSVPFGHSGIHP